MGQKLTSDPTIIKGVAMAFRKKIFICLFIFVFFAVMGTAFAEDRTMILLSKGQVIYVPVYSHIYIGNR